MRACPNKNEIHVRGDGGYVVLPSPINGRKWLNKGRLQPLPDEVLALLRTRITTTGAPADLKAWPEIAREDPGKVARRERAATVLLQKQEGERNWTLNNEVRHLTDFMAKGQLDVGRTFNFMLHAAKAAGLEQREARSTLESTISAGLAGKQPPRVSKIDDTIEVFREHLYLPDDKPLLATIGAVAANLLEDDPVWLLLVGPSSGGKTEMLLSRTGLDYVHLASSLTEGSLLSGTAKKERAAHAKGGLLKEIGEFGILCLKDFGSVLSMSGDARAQTMQALREVYDGRWERPVGTDGGQVLSWSGKIGIVGGVTPTIDRYHAVLDAMGSRFMFKRLPTLPRNKNRQTRAALARRLTSAQTPAALSSAVEELVRGAGATPSELSEDENERLADLADFTALCRSPVERSGIDRVIDLIPESEVGSRLVLELRALLNGLDVLGLERDRAWAVITSIAFDSIPALRLQILRALIDADRDIETTALADGLNYPTKTTREKLEDLQSHGIVVRTSRGSGRTADRWMAVDWVADFIRNNLPTPAQRAAPKAGGHRERLGTAPLPTLPLVPRGSPVGSERTGSPARRQPQCRV
jgi:hypothetical protein